MGLRMITYGYKMENGIIVVENEEASIVAEIFDRYGQGEILKSIADDLTYRQIPYYQDKREWNKNMIDRIIANRKYIGEDRYPVVVSEDVFNRINGLKNQKGKKKTTHAPEIEYLKSHLKCAHCGRNLYRYPRWSRREKWVCNNGCKFDIYLGDSEIMQGIIDSLVKAKDGRLPIYEKSQFESYNPSLEIVKDTNEINRMIDQSNIQFQTVKNMIFQCVKKKFSCCLDDEAYAHNGFVKKCFEEWDIRNEIDIQFLEKVVKEILVEKDGGITVTLINKARIYGRGITDANSCADD